MENDGKPIRLLIVEEDPHKAEQITSALRATGLQVRAAFAEDDEDMRAALQKTTTDLVLFALDLPEFSLAQGRECIDEVGATLGLIALARELTPEVTAAAMAEGARDATSLATLDHLIQVVSREARTIQGLRQLETLANSLQESEKRCQNLLASSVDAVSYVHEGLHVFANQAYLDLFGIPGFDELEGTTLIDMADTAQREQLKAFLRDHSGEEGEMELELIHRNGDKMQVALEFSPASYDGEPCTQILIRASDGTVELEERIKHLHEHDLVSGLYNRQYFMATLKNALASAVKGKRRFALIYIAIDNFPEVRNTLGISGCDTLIGDIARIIRKAADNSLTAARFGASAYTAIGRIDDTEVVEKVAGRIVRGVEQHIVDVGDQSLSATVTAVVMFIDAYSPNNPNAIIQRIEKTCDEIQKSGGNQAITYELKADEMTEGEQDGITADLIKEAINQNRIAGLYQPIVGVKGQDGERYQSSVGITTDDGRELGEMDYRGAAERTGTAKMLDRWRILHAIKKVRETNAKGRKIEFFIPLGADSIHDAGLAPWISENISKAKIDGHQLVFMLNEAQMLSQLKAAKALTAALRQHKCQFAIDEFGAGSNPFQLVKHIDADYVRINHEFMEGLAQNPDNQQNIRELTHRANESEIKTITPGVIDASALTVLWTLDVDFIQGDFLQAPQANLEYDFSSM